MEITSHKYCFISGRHGGSLYIKLGAACKLHTEFFLEFQNSLFIVIIYLSKFKISLLSTGFFFGLLVYSSIQIAYDAYFISSNGNRFPDCVSYIKLVVNILFPIYSVFALFFIIKYMNVVINANQNLARIFLMHAIGTSLALWIYTIIQETAHAIAEHSGMLN